jgi:GDP-4-dehydro-6-deoxy-D-mannose reductase
MGRALVIGAAGFVGNYLVPHLQNAGDDVVAATFGGILQGFNGSVIPLDIREAADCSAALQRIKPDAVYHLAGISFVPQAEADFEQALLVNVNGTANVVRQCHLLGTPLTLVFVSSAEVYGHVAPGELPIREQNLPRPANNYSLSKRMAELVVERYGHSSVLRTVIVRPFNHIGPGQDARFVVSSFASQLAKIARKQAPPVLQVGNLEARRDFSDVRDIVRAYRMLAHGGSGIYNLGSGTPRSIRDVLDTLIRISAVQVEVRLDPTRMRGPEVPELYCSYDKAQAELGWKPEFSFERSLEDVYRYWFDKVN